MSDFCVLPSDVDYGMFGEKYDSKVDRPAMASIIINGLKLKVLHDAPKHMYYYHNGLYDDRGAETIVCTMIREFLGARNTKREMAEVLDAFIRTSPCSIITRDEINSNPYFVPVGNGVFDIKERAFHRGDNGYINTWRLPLDYNPDARCPNLLKFLSDVLHPEDILTIQEMFGYCLYGRCDFEKAFMFIGSGSNGKGVLLHFLTNFLGKINVCDNKIQQMEGESYYTGKLFGKIANICNDIEPDALRHTGNLKLLISGEPVQAREIYDKPFSLSNRAKMIFSTNDPPKVFDDTDGWHRRWEYVTFPNTFSDELGNKDPELKQKLVTAEELSGAFNWALEGIYRLFDNGKFSNSKSTNQIRKYYNSISDPVAVFIEENILFEDDAHIPKEELYNIFKEWSGKNNLHPIMNDIAFGKAFAQATKRQVTSGRTTFAGGNRKTTYRGIICDGFDFNEYCFRMERQYAEECKNGSSSISDFDAVYETRNPDEYLM